MAEHVLRTPYLPVLSSATSDTESRSDPLCGVAAILGGERIVLKPDEEWPQCPKCERHLIPLVQMDMSSPLHPQEVQTLVKCLNKAADGHRNVLRVFVCSDADCFLPTYLEEDGCAWLVRIEELLLAVDSVPSLSVLAAQSILNSNTPSHEEILPSHLVDQVSKEQMRLSLRRRHSDVRLQLREGGLFRKESRVIGWTPGKPETKHWEDLYGPPWPIDSKSEFYVQHEPRKGVKLLGYEVQGKYHFDELLPEGCSGEGCSFRTLLQLGSEEDAREEGLGLMPEADGNWWIAMCETHGGVALHVSGTW